MEKPNPLSLFEQILVCPRDQSDLNWQDERIFCKKGHQYPIINGIPIMLINEVPPTHPACTNNLKKQRQEFLKKNFSGVKPYKGIPSFVQKNLVETCGFLYGPLIDKLDRYPIPFIPIEPSKGDLLLDIGCNWGRWAISAARKGYRVVGLDPTLEALLTAKDISRQLKLSINFVCGDSRYLPFKNNSYKVIFSYSVFQHFSNKDLEQSLSEVKRTLSDSGFSLIQMPNKFGSRNIFNQIRMRFQKKRIFDVRYRTPRNLLEVFNRQIGKSCLKIDGFFSVNPQKSDLDILPYRYKIVVGLSQLMKIISKKLSFLLYFSDSLFIKSKK